MYFYVNYSQNKTIELEHLQSMMSSFIDHVVLEQREDIETKMVQLQEQWRRFESYLAKRIELGEKYAGFHSLAVKVAHQVSIPGRRKIRPTV
jgi:hypothetical protein